MAPSSTTEAALASVAGIRRAHASSDTSEVKVRASHGVKGGWSTYPQAGASIRK